MNRCVSVGEYCPLGVTILVMETADRTQGQRCYPACNTRPTQIL